MQEKIVTTKENVPGKNDDTPDGDVAEGAVVAMEATNVSYPTQIQDGATRELVEAVIVEGVGEAVAKTVDLKWKSELYVMLTELMINNPNEYEEPEHTHWNWQRKIAHMQEANKDYKFLALKRQDQIEGMACITLGAKCRISEQVDQPLIYIEYISTAPWNLSRLLSKLGKTPRYRAVGPALVGTIIEYSAKHGFSGKIGLHALPQAAEFYRDACKMMDLGPDETHDGLRYFEFTAEQSQVFLRGE